MPQHLLLSLARFRTESEASATQTGIFRFVRPERIAGEMRYGAQGRNSQRHEFAGGFASSNGKEFTGLRSAVPRCSQCAFVIASGIGRMSGLGVSRVANRFRGRGLRPLGQCGPNTVAASWPMASFASAAHFFRQTEYRPSP